MESVDPTQNHKRLSAIILAAGLSRRMGEDNKLLLKYKDSSLIQETIRQLSMATGIYETIVVLGHEFEKVKNHITGENLKIILNQDFKTGQTSSIQTGVRAADTQSQGYMICLGDMPFILTEDYDSIITFWNQSAAGSIVRPFIENKPGHPVIFDSCYQSDILAETYSEGCRTVIRNNADNLIQYFSDKMNYLIDIDQPSDKIKLESKRP